MLYVLLLTPSVTHMIQDTIISSDLKCKLKGRVIKLEKPQVKVAPITSATYFLM